MALYCDKERKFNFCQKKMKTRMDKGTYEERRRVKTDFSLAIAELWHGQGFRESNPVYKDLQEAGKELEADSEKFFHFEWNIVDIDESHIYVTNKSNGHRYHVSVIYPAALYVDVFSIEDDGTEIRAFP